MYVRMYVFSECDELTILRKLFLQHRAPSLLQTPDVDAGLVPKLNTTKRRACIHNKWADQIQEVETIRGRCYDHNFLRFSPIFGEKFVVFSKTNVMNTFVHYLALF
jgi:hypothetical protein